MKHVLEESNKAWCKEADARDTKRQLRLQHKQERSALLHANKCALEALLYKQRQAKKKRRLQAYNHFSKCVAELRTVHQQRLLALEQSQRQSLVATSHDTERQNLSHESTPAVF